MRYGDLKEARRQLGLLEDLLSLHKPGGRDLRMQALVQLLCGSLARAVSDGLCQALVGDLKGYAMAVYSDDHEEWARSGLDGRDYLRLQIYKSLNAVDARLRRLESIRLATPSSAAVPLGAEASPQ